jgi:hypothetical protein
MACAGQPARLAIGAAMRSLLLAASVVAALTGSAEAETNPANPRAYLTGDDLFDWCRASSHDGCWGYVSALPTL